MTKNILTQILISLEINSDNIQFFKIAQCIYYRIGRKQILNLKVFFSVFKYLI